MDWNFDMSAVPLDRAVILAGKKDHVTRSRWLPAGKERKVGRWEGFTATEKPVAWMLWPEHPGGSA